MTGPSLYLRSGGARPGKAFEGPASAAVNSEGGAGWYLCACCDEKLARAAWVINRNGEEFPLFTNPEGYAFRLLLVDSVVSVEFNGPALTEHSWFRGFAWRVGWCHPCGSHVGWRFEQVTGRGGEFVALSRAALKFMNGS